MRHKTKCLVVGGGGFLGRHLVEHLLDVGCYVRVYDRLPHYPQLKNIANASVEYVQGDFCTEANFLEVVKNVDVIFHLISTSLPTDSNLDPVNDAVKNIIPTLRLLEAARLEAIDKVIFFSSGGTVYGQTTVSPIPESHPTNPLCAYGAHKVATELYLGLYHRLYNLDYRVMRIANPFGTYQATNHLQGVIPIFMQKIMGGEVIEIWGDGTIIRDYISADDVMRAGVYLMDYNGDEKVFNVGVGRGLSLSDLVVLLQKIVGKKARIRYLPARSADVKSNVLDTSKMQTETGWKPSLSTEEGMRRLFLALSE